MMNVDVADVRNFAILGHTSSGKTTLVDALLHRLGVTERMGTVDNGSSAADYSDEEKARKITLSAKPFTGQWKDSTGAVTQMTFTDTPGYADFIGQVISATSASDAALVMVDATSGIQVGTTLAWRQCGKLELPRAVVISGLDRENADFGKILAQVQEAWGTSCLPVLLPAAGGGVVSVLGADAADGEMKDQVDAARSALIEKAAETDDALTEKYLMGEALSDEELATGLRDAVKTRALVPVFAISALQGTGLEELLDGIRRMFPSPADRERVDAEGAAIQVAPDAPFAGQVWRTVNDAFVGQLTFVRVFSGTLKENSEVWNATRGQKEQVGVMLLVNGKQQEAVQAATAGDIVALAKLKITKLGDSLCATGSTLSVPAMKFPNPVTSFAVVAKTRGDEDKIGVALSRVADDDPTIRVERNAETHETLLHGMGDVHIDVAVERMKKRSNVDVVLSTPKVPYRETVTAVGEGHYRHKKQTGGRGQFGEVYLRVSPKTEDEEEWFENAIVGGAIPGSFLPAVQKGLVEGMSKGSMAGYPVTGVKVTVYDGSYHEVDSSEVSFKIAGSRAFRDGMSKAKPVLLEPIMTVRIMIPDQYVGDVNSDMSHKRGRVLGMGSEEGMLVITAEVPQAELFRYSAELRSMTGGRGSFEMEFARYDIVPSNVAQKVIAAAQKEDEEED